MKKIYLFLILFSFQFFFTQTTYEKKVSDIKNSFFTKMGLSIQNSDIWNNWDFNNNSDFMKFLYDNDNNKYFNQKFLGNLKSNEGQNLTLTFLKQLQDAKKLKTQEDLKKENYINLFNPNDKMHHHFLQNARLSELMKFYTCTFFGRSNKD